MPDAPKMPSIPSPLKSDLDARYEAIMALKMGYEMMVGTRGNAPVGRVFVSDSTPSATNTGDLWIQTSSGNMSYWDGTQWLPVRSGARAAAAKMTAGIAITTTPTTPTFGPPSVLLQAIFDQANGRFTPGAGIYQVSAQVGMITGGNNAELFIALRKNGVEALRGSQSGSAAGIPMTANVTTAIRLNQGEYIDTVIWSDRTGQTVDAFSSGFSAIGTTLGG